MGSEAMPMGLSISSDHARPSLPTFLSLICLRGLKCWEPKLPPLTSQFSPVCASPRTRCAFTLPALPALVAAMLWRPAPSHNAQQSPTDDLCFMLFHPPNGFHPEGTRLNDGHGARVRKVRARIGEPQPGLGKFVGQIRHVSRQFPGLFRLPRAETQIE